MKYGAPFLIKMFWWFYREKELLSLLLLLLLLLLSFFFFLLFFPTCSSSSLHTVSHSWPWRWRPSAASSPATLPPALLRDPRGSPLSTSSSPPPRVIRLLFFSLSGGGPYSTSAPPLLALKLFRRRIPPLLTTLTALSAKSVPFLVLSGEMKAKGNLWISLQNAMTLSLDVRFSLFPSQRFFFLPMYELFFRLLR